MGSRCRFQPPTCARHCRRAAFCLFSHQRGRKLRPSDACGRIGCVFRRSSQLPRHSSRHLSTRSAIFPVRRAMVPTNACQLRELSVFFFVSIFLFCFPVSEENFIQRALQVSISKDPLVQLTSLEMLVFALNHQVRVNIIDSVTLQTHTTFEPGMRPFPFPSFLFFSNNQKPSSTTYSPARSTQPAPPSTFCTRTRRIPAVQTQTTGMWPFPFPNSGLGRTLTICDGWLSR